MIRTPALGRAGHLSLHVPGADAVRHQGRQGHHRRGGAGLAESWTLSPEGTIWTFKLKKGVQFHKGFGEMTAEDVKFSFDRQINKTPGTRYGVNLDVIKTIEVSTRIQCRSP